MIDSYHPQGHTIEVGPTTEIKGGSTDLKKKTAKKLAKGGKNKKEVDMKEWYSWVETCSKKYGVSKYLALALAEVESSKGKLRYRFGWISKTYCGPYGIHKCFGKKPYYWDIENPYINTEVGIRALARHIKKQGSLRKALRKYNTGDGQTQFIRYCKRIEYLAARNEKERVFDRER